MSTSTSTSTGNRTQPYAHGAQHPSTYHKWGLVDVSGRVTTEDGRDAGLGLVPIANRLFAKVFPPNVQPIEWTRIGFYQDVSMRLIAERLIASEYQGRTYLQGELTHERVVLLPPPPESKRFHICCSPHNLGALALIHEVQRAPGMQALAVTDAMESVGDCERFLVYLNADTWTRHPDRFGADVQHALDADVRLLVVHEYPGLDTLSARGAIPFRDIIDSTPQPLLSQGVYNMIAIALKAGEWRKVSRVMVAQELAEGLQKPQWHPLMSVARPFHAARSVLTQLARVCERSSGGGSGMAMSSSRLPQPQHNGRRSTLLVVDSPLAFHGDGRHHAPSEDVSYVDERAAWGDEREASSTPASCTELVAITERALV